MRVLVCGTFDHLHPGHRFFLREAQKLGQKLYVIVARDASVKRIKGQFPLQSEKERMAAVCEAFPGAVVVLGHAKDFLIPVKSIAPDILCLGYDQVLPAGIQREDLACDIVRVGALDPSRYKSSLLRESQD
ncbi:FAD synthase [Candidatus Peregrinibacteria bacterium CG10_big_fil_rev_8_21_14_0_10_49_16]|nr:MAG: FAD synthase [Candidatus Peregrinibacteria bacterium CG22_combo_CG10-13_8_21_14_all_49_11]PIR52456.1 MAG: FAD synthase [Candidatus Peregrinibacteria bacterium CG10_big_fil_rev_8_21_14_0_10_49_16]